MFLPDRDEILLVGDSPTAARLRAQIERVAGTPRTTVLLRGEAGLELDRLARAIHARSAEAAQPFRSADCPSLEPVAQALMDAEYGTLYLGEVGVLGDADQAILLDHLEQRAAAPSEARKALSGARLVASTSMDLDLLVDEGRFREDLFYRLNVLSVGVPPLRERRSDLERIAAQALRRIGKRLGKPLRLDPKALALLKGHAWAGNLFELETVLGLGALHAAATGVSLSPEHLPLAAGPPAEEPDPGLLEPAQPHERSLRALEEATIRRVLREEGGNRSRAARVLGINRTTLYNKLRLYGIA